MNEKKYIIAFASFVLLLMGIISTFNFVVDPFHFYRINTFYKPQYSESMARYELPGIINNIDYDMLMVGTSMSRNFSEEYMNEVLKKETFNAALPSGKAKEQAMIVNLALKNSNLEDIFWELNMYSFEGSPDEVLEQNIPFPYHFYDRNPITDFKYLVSWDTVERSIDILENYDEYQEMDIYEIYKFGQNVPPLTKESIGDISLITTDSYLNYRFTSAALMESFEQNVLPFVEKNPHITFTFYYVPYPITNHLYFYNLNNRYIDERELFKLKVFQALNGYDNVKIYDFQDEKEITHKISNYMDSVHYYMETNHQLFDAMVYTEPIKSLEEQILKNTVIRNQILNLTNSSIQ
ncbi:hypothetical protein ACERII_24130 [Evansella sp. AB-rgal1]|uniref:hypothetical protein n=1 Tax=Evansella sp. AB-rgal1 TaxID=3242696 RepID=UPI00359D8465